MSSDIIRLTIHPDNTEKTIAITTPAGGNISKPISGETRYTLSCIDLSGATQTKTATVRILPTFQKL